MQVGNDIGGSPGKNEGQPKNDSMLFFMNGMQQKMGRNGVISKV